MTPTKTRIAPAMTTTAALSPLEWHRRQRALVAASMIAVPGVKRPTHRRWA